MRVAARAAEAYDAPGFRLDGGTALAAYYLGHRESEDLDFFSDFGVDQRELSSMVVEIASSEGLALKPASDTRATRSFARFHAHDAADESGLPVKLDFASQSPFRLEPLAPTTEEVRVASYRDLTANKLHAICDRIEVRDFIDLHVILNHGSGNENAFRERARALVRDVMEIDPGLNARLVGDAVARGLGRPLLVDFPLRVLVPMTEAEVQRTLRLFAAECAEMVADSA